MTNMEKVREKIIVVDDIATNLVSAKEALSEHFDVFTASSGHSMLQLLKQMTPNLILLDIGMPDMDGFEAISKLKSSERTVHIPVIFLTGNIDPEHEIKGLSLGAVDYITKPFSKELLLRRVSFHILLENQRKELLRHNLSLENEIHKKEETVTTLQLAILKTIAELVESRDNITGDHIGRTHYSMNLLIALLIDNGVYVDELATMDIPLLILSSMLHDVGKIAIRDSILLKPGKLTAEEFEEMKKHASSGVGIIRKIETKAIDNEFLHYAEECAGTHHERWDGKGYPYGLREKEIPLAGRLMAIVDVYDALVSIRSYKDRMSHEEAVSIIRENLGTQFDPAIGQIFVDNHILFKDMVAGDMYNNQLYNARHEAILSRINTAKAGGESVHMEKTQRYLEILYDAVQAHATLHLETAGWDKNIFLEAVYLRKVGNTSHIDHFANISASDMERIQHHAEVIDGSSHEKWDGSGYPLGLSGTDIPIEGRLMAIIDVYDSLVTDRPHRKRKTHHEAIVLIQSGVGSHFDPDLVELFLDKEKLFEKISE